MDLERLIPALSPSAVTGRARVEVRDLAYDARAVEPGALSLVVERPLDVRVPQLVVGDARAAMAPAADIFFGHPTRELTVAGVTGTNGKTTTAYLLRAILATPGLRPGL